jgi:extracellular elastinolytic metalloproteinase
LIHRALVSLAVAALALPAAAGAAPSRVHARFDGTLSGPAAGAPETVALGYVRAHRSALGLDAADLDALGAPDVTSSGAITQVRWPQEVDGIPAADSELKVNLAADGRVLNVLGEPAHDLDANTTPLVDAGEAVRAVQASVGAFRPVPRDKGPSGATRAMTYADGTTVELALDGRRLVWRVTYRASSTEVYDAFVDARSGGVRRTVNMVKSDTPALVWENFPGAALGGTAISKNLELNGWLAAGATRLSGPNVHAYSDLDDDDFADATEEIGPSYSIALQTFSPAGGGCAGGKPCTWNHLTNNWELNRRQNAVQAFYLANRFHDHLATAPISFGTTSGSFDAGSDPLELQSDDGAGTGPDLEHRNNANMFTPPDGTRPVMQMYLWRPSRYRTMNGGDDASIVYHEYTHGLSNRLVTDAGGRGALNSPQAGAMGEGWSDWYAKDFLVGQFAGLDTATVGDVDMGVYTDSTAHSIRTQGLDCPVTPVVAACSGTATAGTGGYTYGDFGRIVTVDGVPVQEVHYDGEIWAETLWDLRTAVGSAAARRLITDGMRLSPAEPSFLDMRNAILLADQSAGGTLRGAIWTVFAKRGMGYYASTNEGTSVPLEDFSQPPAPGDPRGRIAGAVRDSASGQPVTGATAAIGGLTQGPDRLVGTSGADGAFAIENVPVRTYPNVVVSAPGYDTLVSTVTVTAGATAPLNPLLARNWAAVAGGAAITPGPGSDEYASQGCGPEAAVDQRQGTGWSTDASPAGKSMVVTLPGPINVSDFAVDPTEACGDEVKAATSGYRIETSTQTVDGPWIEAASGAFGPSARHALNPVTAAPAATAGVRHVRVSLLSSQGGGDFFDLSEFTVHGAPVPVQTPVPPPPAPVQPPVPTPTPIPIAAPSFVLPASGKTTVKFKVTCAADCKVTAKLTVDRPTAKRLGLGRVLTAGSLTATVKAGKKTLTLKLASKARRALLKGSKKARYRARLKATAAYTAKAPVSRSRQLTLKR